MPGTIYLSASIKFEKQSHLHLRKWRAVNERSQGISVGKSYMTHTKLKKFAQVLISMIGGQHSSDTGEEVISLEFSIFPKSHKDCSVHSVRTLRALAWVLFPLPLSHLPISPPKAIKGKWPVLCQSSIKVGSRFLLFCSFQSFTLLLHVLLCLLSPPPESHPNLSVLWVPAWTSIPVFFGFHAPAYILGQWPWLIPKYSQVHWKYTFTANTNLVWDISLPYPVHYEVQDIQCLTFYQQESRWSRLLTI